MAAFGFVSGLPLSLSGFTLRQWLTEGHVSLAAIGLTANIGLPYTLKFLWAPLLDQVRPPGMLGRLGRRRGWLLMIQPPLALACLVLALCDAAAAPGIAISAAAAIAFLSATQDIAIDAWRIEHFPQRLQGAATAVYVWGYRVAMLVSGSAVIYAAARVGWNTALLGVAILAALGIAVTLAAPEAPAPARMAVISGFLGRIAAAVRDPLRDFLSRPGAVPILAYVALFNLGEAMAGVMLAPFYRFLGFDGKTVAALGPFSLLATMAGIGLGGWLVSRVGLRRALISTGFIQMAAMAMYVVLSRTPGHTPTLFAIVTAEAFVQGLASAAFLAFLSGLCAPQFAATQYALLSSVAPIASHTVGGFSGYLVQETGWTLFYALAMLASLPAMIIMLHTINRYRIERRDGGPGGSLQG